MVGPPSGDIDDAVRVVRTALIVGFVLLLAVLAAVVWRFVGATLRPVEALRAGAEKITGANSTDTLPLPDSADEIRRLAETLNDMLARLEVSRRRQRAFVADAAHELRSPLTSLRTQLEVAVATGDEPDTADLVAEVDRLTGLVEDLLLLARVDDGDAPAHGTVSTSANWPPTMAKRYAAARVPVVVQVDGRTGRSRRTRSRDPGAGQPAGQRRRLRGDRGDGHRAAGRRRRRAGGDRRRRARASRPPTGSGSSNVSPGCRTPATGTAAAADWGWRSSGN